jgi:hypothetical protein
VSGIGGVEHAGSLCEALGGEAVVDVVWRQQREPVVVMLGVVPVEEGTEERAGMVERGEPRGEVGAVLEGLEMRLGERVM